MNRLLIGFVLIAAEFAAAAAPVEPGPLIQDISILRASYPDVVFSTAYDDSLGDWAVSIRTFESIQTLYWAGGRFISKEELSHKADFRLLIYEYYTKTADPSLFTESQIESARKAGSYETRQNGPVQGTSFFDIVYDSATRLHLERHLKSVSFLGKAVTVHEKIVPALARVERRIRALEQSDPKVLQFVQNIGSIGGYHWRSIRDSSGRSFHSMGLAVDILPKKLNGKSIYWEWEKMKPNPDWMLVPLSDRWIPPESVLEAFYSEGFIWGGNWIVWDNMHFEYRPELIVGHRQHFFQR